MAAHEACSLLIDGREAFPEIIRCIEQAENSIKINMFIWRADAIGIEIAQALLNAAERGVLVDISVDRYALSLEKGEESAISFFHENPSLKEWAMIFAIRFFYPGLINPYANMLSHKEILQKMLSHDKIKIHREEAKADHSKYYIFDDRIIIFGGINIEDKENGADWQGRIYKDLMVKLCGEQIVQQFYHKQLYNQNQSGEYQFCMNNKTMTPPVFEMEQQYLQMIQQAEKELVIVMAYFTPTVLLEKKIINAYKRGVHVIIIVPGSPNFQNNSNRRSLDRLMRKSNNGIDVFLSPKMIHTKLLYNENTICFGSSNITPKAFHQLGELNLKIDNVVSPMQQRLMHCVENYLSESKKIEHYKQLTYHRIFAFFESLFV